MRDALTGLLEKADLALASCSGVIDPQRLEGLIAAVKAVRARLAYPEDFAVAALVGGTGSGKSSLFNALAGADLADVGGIRPTTTDAAAVVPAGSLAAMEGYLDLLGIVDVHEGRVGELCLLDLPDVDSVESAHRDTVDRLLPMVDLVVWVVDPEKYRDARLHNEYIAPLAEYSAQFVFVLNQIDRVGEESHELIADLRSALAEDGVPDPTVIPVAAAPPAGPPIGIELLRSELTGRVGQGEGLHTKLLTDLSKAAQAIESEAGRPVDFDQRAADALDEATASLVVGELESSSETLTGFLDAVATETGGPTADAVRRLTADAPQHLRRIRGELTTEIPARWPWQKPTSSEPDPDAARKAISDAVVRPVRAVLAKRAVALASIADLTLEVQSLSYRTGR